MENVVTKELTIVIDVPALAMREEDNVDASLTPTPTIEVVAMKRKCDEKEKDDEEKKDEEKRAKGEVAGVVVVEKKKNDAIEDEDASATSEWSDENDGEGEHVRNEE